MKGSNEVENKEFQPEKRLYRRKSGNQDIKRRKWSLVSFERNKIFILLRSNGDPFTGCSLTKSPPQIFFLHNWENQIPCNNTVTVRRFCGTF